MNIYNPNTLIEFAKKKKSNVRTCLNGANNATGASQTFDTAKVQINSEITKQKLENLKEKYKNVKIPYGFLTDLRSAMGLPPVKRASNYGIITIPKADGTSTVSIRISNHSTNAGTYITNNANQEYNLSIVVRKRARKKTFIPHDDVRLDEYIYYGNRLNSVESPLVQIINSIIGFLDSGVYVDTTGVALHNTSPQQPIQENNKQINTNKNIMKITENQLRRIIKESIENVLSEISFSTANRAGIEAMYRASELEKAGKQKEADRKWQQHRKFDDYANNRYEELKDEKGLHHALEVSRGNWKDAYQKWEPETYNKLYGQQ